MITLVIYLCEFGINKLGIVNVEATTTLDFLFILYITGSMRPYLDEIKENIINIINGIIKESRNWYKFKIYWIWRCKWKI